MIHFSISSITSLFAFSASILSYWELTNQTIHFQFEVDSKWRMVILRSTKPDSLQVPLYISEDKNTIITCSANTPTKLEDLTNYMIHLSENYMSNELIPFFHSHINSAASKPIWYYQDSFVSHEEIQIPVFFVTTDPMLLFEYKISHFHLLQPNHWMTINLKSNKVVNLISLKMQNIWQPVDEQNLPVVAELLLQQILFSLQSSLEKTHYSSEDKIILEISDLYPITKLFDCAAESLKLSRYIKNSSPFLPDSPLLFPEFLNQTQTMVHNTDCNFETHVLDSLEFKLYDRMKFCNTNNSVGRTIFISFHGGNDNKEMETGFQNFLCPLFNTTVIYPARDPAFQQFLNQFYDPSGLIAEAASFLSNSQCSRSQQKFLANDELYCDENNLCVDYLVKYVNEERFLISNKSWLANNHALRMNLSSLPNQGSSSNETKHENIMTMFLNDAKDYSTSDGHLILISFSREYDSLEILSNYLCHLELTFKYSPRLPLLILTDDSEYLAHLEYTNFLIVPSSMCSIELTKEISESMSMTDTLEFCLLHVLLTVLRIGIHPIYTNIDTLWLRNPLPLLTTRTVETNFQSQKSTVFKKQENHPMLLGKDGNFYNSRTSTHSPSELEEKISKEIKNVENNLLVGLFGVGRDEDRKNNSSQQKIHQQRLEHHMISSFTTIRRIENYDIAFTAQQNKMINLHFLVFRSSSKNIQFITDFLMNFYIALEFLVAELKSSADETNDRVNFDFLLQRMFDYYLLESQLTSKFHISLKYLDSKIFATTFNHFFDKSSRQTASILMNNYALNFDSVAKYYRLLKYGYWIYFPPYFSLNDDRNQSNRRPLKHYSNDYCVANHFTLAAWNQFYDQRWKNFLSSETTAFIRKYDEIYSFEIMQPFHNELISSQNYSNFVNRKLAVAFLEGDFELKHERPVPNVLINTFLNSKALYGFERLAYYDMTRVNPNSSLLSLSFLVRKTNLQNHVDALLINDKNIQKTGFGIDYADLDLHIAVDHAINFSRNWKRSLQGGNISRMNETDFQFPISDNDFLARQENDSELFHEGFEDVFYTIKVLAFNRPDSLQRLLHSLQAADYGKYDKNISLEILIDHFREINEESTNLKVQQIAEEFQWNHGSKRVIYREENIGLANQWYKAWIPQALNDLAFIFEDDIEVSPYFFIWASKAVHNYYLKNQQLQRLHKRILQTVREKIVSSPIPPNSSIDGNEFAEFVKEYLGFPLIYGVCPQKQPLDAQRYPKTLHLRTGYRPFLYSPIGTWGPLLFPVFWTAFREWWQWKVLGNQTPKTADLCQNLFFEQNNRIWSPYFVRFSYEFGGKCLYSNLPSNLTLITNYREAGENYQKTLGSYARLVNSQMIEMMEKNQIPLSNDLTISDFEERNLINVEELASSLLYFPTLVELVYYQFDFNQRQISTFGINNPFPLISNLRGNNQTELEMYLTTNFSCSNRSNLLPECNFIEDSLLFQSSSNLLKENRLEMSKKYLESFLQLNHFYQLVDYSNHELKKKISQQDDSSLIMKPSLTLLHWIELKIILESHVLPSSMVLFLDLNPLLFFFHNDYGLTHNYEYELLLTAVFPSRSLDVITPCTQFFHSIESYRNLSDRTALDNYIFQLPANSFETVDCYDYYSLRRSSESDSSVKNVKVLVVTLQNIVEFANYSNETTTFWKNWIQNRYDFSTLEYLLLIDNCITAPDLLSFTFMLPGEGNFARSLEFQAIEKLCDLVSMQDYGGVLYRLKSKLDRIEFSKFSIPDQSSWITRRYSKDFFHSYLAPFYHHAIFP